MCDTALEIIARHAEAGAALRSAFFAAQGARVAEAARHMAVSLARGGKILLAGNGGSAADAQHWAGEFVNRFILDRPPLPAIALSTDSSVLTAIGNDFGYDRVFAKQIEALEEKKNDNVTEDVFETPWLKRLLELKDIESLDRDIVVEMISEIKVYENRKIKITYNFGNELEHLFSSVYSDNFSESQ